MARVFSKLHVHCVHVTVRPPHPQHWLPTGSILTLLIVGHFVVQCLFDPWDACICNYQASDRLLISSTQSICRLSYLSLFLMLDHVELVDQLPCFVSSSWSCARGLVL